MDHAVPPRIDTSRHELLSHIREQLQPGTEAVSRQISATAEASLWRVGSEGAAIAIKVFDVSATSQELLWQRAEVQRLAHVGGVCTPDVIPTAAGDLLWKTAKAATRLGLVTRWIEGETPGRVANTEGARLIGEQLGRLHSLRLPGGLVDSLAPDFSGLATGRLADSVPAGLRATIGLVRELCVRYAPASGSVTGHGDIDQKNVVLTPEAAFLIDWANAGPVDPAAELASALIEWTGCRQGGFHRHAAHALIQGYRGAGGFGEVTSVAAFAPWALEEVRWLVECAQSEEASAATEMGWFHRHFERVLRLLPDLVAALPPAPAGHE